MVLGTECWVLSAGNTETNTLVVQHIELNRRTNTKQPGTAVVLKILVSMSSTREPVRPESYPAMVAHTCNSSTQEGEVGGSPWV